MARRKYMYQKWHKPRGSNQGRKRNTADLDRMDRKFKELASPVKTTYRCICPRDGCRADRHLL